MSSRWDDSFAKLGKVRVRVERCRNKVTDLKSELRTANNDLEVARVELRVSESILAEWKKDADGQGYVCPLCNGTDDCQKCKGTGLVGRGPNAEITCEACNGGKRCGGQHG